MKIIYRLTTMEFGCESTRNGRKESVSDYKLSLKVGKTAYEVKY